MDRMDQVDSDIADLINRLPSCQFVAIDCEFSGIDPKPKSIRNLSDYLTSLKANAEKYTLLQIGFCLAEYVATPERAKWTLYPYNFYTISTKVNTTLVLNDTLVWLRNNGFSLDRWVDEGIECKRLVDIQNEDSFGHVTKRQRRNHLHQILEVMIESKMPLVFHNGLLDLFHIYDKLIGEIPENDVEISKEFTRLFVGGIFDTKVVAKHMCEFCDSVNLKNTTLPTLYAHLNSFHNMKELTEISQERLNFNYIDKETGDINKKNFHEAGFDATVTAMIFCVELKMLADLDGIQVADLLNSHFEGTNYGGHLEKLVNTINIHESINQPTYNFKTYCEEHEAS